MAAVVLGLPAPAVQAPIPIRPSRVRMTWPAGSWTRPARGWPDVQVWAMGGRWSETETVATATTDGQGRFVLPQACDRKATIGR